MDFRMLKQTIVVLMILYLDPNDFINLFRNGLNRKDQLSQRYFLAAKDFNVSPLQFKEVQDLPWKTIRFAFENKLFSPSYIRLSQNVDPQKFSVMHLRYLSDMIDRIYHFFPMSLDSLNPESSKNNKR